MRELSAVAVALMAMVTPDGPAPEIRETTTYYDVTGQTADELRKAMSHAGPLGGDGTHVDALASWKVHYTYQTMAAAGGCALRKLAVKADITTILPRWVDKPATSSALTDRWEKHLTTLRSNLAGIQDIGRRAAATLQETIRMLPTQPRCATLDDTIDITADDVIQRYLRENEEYDEALKVDPARAARFP